MFNTTRKLSPWRRIERVTSAGEVRDYVEVGACGRCGRGVDRLFPVEYREIAGELACVWCLEADSRHHMSGIETAAPGEASTTHRGRMP
jgi:hypothetical protein